MGDWNEPGVAIGTTREFVGMGVTIIGLSLTVFFLLSLLFLLLRAPTSASRVFAPNMEHEDGGDEEQRHDQDWHRTHFQTGGILCKEMVQWQTL